MAEIYIAFVDTPGFFAGIIRSVIRQKYIHVALSLDPYLEKEDKYKILRAFPDADYMVCSVRCTSEQKEYIEQQLDKAMEQRFHYHYAVIGLPFILMNIPFYQKNHYTCSSYLARLLEEAGVCKWDKHFSLVTPKDFYEYEGKKKIFEGSLYEFTVRGKRHTERKRIPAVSFMQPAYAGAAYIINFLKRGVNL